VAEAIVFAEVLVPMLARRLAVQPPAPHLRAAPPAPRTGPAEARGIADFIDEMLGARIAWAPTDPPACCNPFPLHHS